MLEPMRAFIAANPILATTLASLWGAVVLDLVSFATSKDPGGWFNGFSPKVAGLKYLQATVSGFVGNFLVIGAGAAAAGAASLVALGFYALFF